MHHKGASVEKPPPVRGITLWVSGWNWRNCSLSAGDVIRRSEAQDASSNRDGDELGVMVAGSHLEKVQKYTRQHSQRCSGRIFRMIHKLTAALSLNAKRCGLRTAGWFILLEEKNKDLLQQNIKMINRQVHVECSGCHCSHVGGTSLQC